METQAYTIVAMIGRYILITLCFLVFVQAVLEIRKASQSNTSTELASLRWLRKRVVFDLANENIIGRSNKCDIAIKAPTVKRRHFRLYSDSDEWIVVPYKKAEVYINEHLIDGTAQVEDGDKISIGRENMIFQIMPNIDEEVDV